jgi:hypothetical protein
VQEINLSMDNSLSAIDIMLDQLKLAIEEKDLKKIKDIVKTMDEDEKVENKTETTTEAMTPPPSTPVVLEISTKLRSRIYLAPKLRTSTAAITEPPTTTAAPKPEPSTDAPMEMPTTVASKIYLAPKVRAAQKKLKQVKAKSMSDEIPKETSSAAPVTETPTTLKMTTEKRMLSTVAKAEPLNARPTKRKRSHVTPRARHSARRVTRGSQRQGRRPGRKQ